MRIIIFNGNEIGGCPQLLSPSDNLRIAGHQAGVNTEQGHCYFGGIFPSSEKYHRPGVSWSVP